MFKIIKIWILSILVIVVARRLIGKDISRKRCKCVSINLVVDLPLIESIQEKVIFIVVVAVAVVDVDPEAKGDEDDRGSVPIPSN